MEFGHRSVSTVYRAATEGAVKEPKAPVFPYRRCTLNEIACSRPETGRRTGDAGALTFRNDRGGIRAKTTAPKARPGITSRTITPARARTAGPRTESPASATITSACVSRSHFGTE